MELKEIIIIFCCFCVVSCTDCETLANSYRDDECSLIVEYIPDIKEKYFNFKGRNPYNDEKCNCKSKISYRWWNVYKDKISKGDTIIKRRGELTFHIHKKDTSLVFNWECNGKTYK